MFQKYNIRDYVQLMEIQKAKTEYVREERKRFGGNRHDLKSTVMKMYLSGALRFIRTCGWTEQ